MADQAISERSQDLSQGSSVDSAKDKISSAGKELREKAAELAGSSKETIKDQAAGAAEAVREVGSHAADRFKQGLEDQKDAGARYVNGIAEAMRRAANEFDQDLPVAGTYLRKGASQVEGAAEALKNGDLNNLLQDARDFARRQPAAFLGLAALAGFGVVRFLKSSAEGTETPAPVGRTRSQSAPQGD